MTKCVATALVLTAAVVGCHTKEQHSTIVVALPATTLLATNFFVAHDAGFFEREALRVTLRAVSGSGAIAAVISGDADFTIGSGPTLLRTSVQDQPLIAVANLVDRPLAELVLRKDVVERVGIDRLQSLARRGRHLKGLTIAVHGLGTMVHAWTEYVVRSGGLSVDTDLRLVPMEPSSMDAAVRVRLIDGYAASPPVSTIGEATGDVVIVASGIDDTDELVPFPYGLVLTKRDTCERKRDVCERFLRALMAAARMIHEESTASLIGTVLRGRFPGVGDHVLHEAWSRVRGAFTTHLAVSNAHLRHASLLMLSGDPAPPPAAMYGRLYTSGYLR